MSTEHPYYDLPYMGQDSFPRTEYGKAAALRMPLRDAINSARSQKREKMEQVVAILETALEHIRQIDTEESANAETLALPAPAASTSSDPLDELLGPAEAVADAGIG